MSITKKSVPLSRSYARNSVHSLYIWEISAGDSAVIGHIEIPDFQEWPRVLREIREMLLSKHGIDHFPLQVEVPSMNEK